FDPTPASIKAGRRLLYDSHSNSGLGQASCASCHVDGRFDRLAWDLGDPSANMISNRFGTFHPMKGPKVTQTMQGLNPDGALHWRADREGIAQFNQTFVNLLGRDTEPTPADDDNFAALLRTVFFPPNPLRNFDNTLSTNVPLPGHYAYDPVSHAPGDQPLPNGNALRGGEVVFRSNCSVCHNPGSGLGDPSAGTVVATIPLGAASPFKVAQLRSLMDKVGFEMTRPESRAGFGFSHDGRVDTLTRFIGDGLSHPTNIQDAADLTAFLLSFAGSDIIFTSNEGGEDVESYHDAPAALGFQTVLTNATISASVQTMMALAEFPIPLGIGNALSAPRLELIARGGGRPGGSARGWHYLDGYFQSDRDEDFLPAADLFSRASPTNELMLILVSRGTARRMAADRDGDGARDLTEVEFGFDPFDAQSHPANLPLLAIAAHSPVARLDAGHTYSNAFMAYGLSHYGTPDEDNEVPTGLVNFSLATGAPAGAAIHPTEGAFSWTPTHQDTGKEHRIAVRVGYATMPAMSETLVLRLTVNGPVLVEPPQIDNFLLRTIIKVHVPDDRVFQVQYTDNPADPSPEWFTLGFTYGQIIDPSWPPAPRRYYRAVFYP
ncbi:MAG TPA: hypothetical protein VNH84_02795, partial [Candidatus Saccharimonadales bacterium]|nr:hypothetical protein [Candidatus Saccharimonadales bacterium]